jgi:hypothetical protein
MESINDYLQARACLSTSRTLLACRARSPTLGKQFLLIYPDPWLAEDPMSFLNDVIQILKSSRGIDTMAKEAMNCHAFCYRDNLHRCSDAMLQYEWAWLEEHVQALRRSQLQPELMRNLG